MADGSVTIKIKGDDSDFSSKVEGLGGKAKSLLALAAKGAIVATGALAGLAGAAIKVGSEFEAEMSKVAAISGASASEMESLTAKAKEMGASTKFSATEAGEAFEYMAMAGWKTEDMLSGIEGIMNLAAASGADLATTSDIVTDALTAFGLQASDAGHFADVLAMASSNANTNVEMMGATFKYAAPIAGALGYSIEDTAVAIGLMANAGIKGEQAGTSLRAMLTRLADPPKEAAQALDKLGISITNADGSMRPLNDVIADLREGFSNLSEAEQTSAASAIAGTNAMSGLLAIVNASESDFQKLTAAVNNADGAAANMATTMQDNLQGQMTILKSGLEGLGIAVYDKLEAPLKKAAQTAIQSVNQLSQAMTSGRLSDSMDNLAAGMGNLMSMAAQFAGAALPVLINGFAMVASHAQELVVILGTVGGAFAAIKAAPIVMEVAAGFGKLVTTAKTAATGILVMDSAMKSVTTATHLANAGFTAYETVVGVATGRVGLATAAQYAWNTALAANPIGAVIAAVAALIGVIALLTIAMDDEASAVEITAGRIEDLTAQLDAEKQKREELAEARQSSIDASMSEIDYTQRQISELSGLIDSNGKVKEGYEARAKVLADSINSVLPGAISLTEREGAAYVELADDIQQVINMKRIEAALEAGKEEYANAIQHQAEALHNLVEASQTYQQAQQDLIAVQAQYDEAAATGIGIHNQYEAALKAAEENARNAGAAYDEAKEAVSEYQQTIQNYEGLQEAMNGDAEAVQAAVDQITYGLQSLTATTESELQAQLAEYDAMISELQALVDQGYAGVTQGAVDELVRMRNETAAKLGEIVQEGAKAGAELPAKTSAGIKGGTGSVVSAADYAGKSAVNALRNSVSGAGAAGTETSTSYGSGISGGAGTVTGAATTVTSGALSQFQTLPGAMPGIGSQVGSGLSSGILAAASRVASAAASLVTRAINAAKAAASIASPSKKMRNEVGKMMSLGLALGITDEIPTAQKSASKVVDAVSGLMLSNMETLTAELAELQKRADARDAAERLERYEESIKKKNEEIEKAETDDKAKLQRELARMEEEWLDEQKEATLKSQQETLKEQQKLIENWQKDYEKAISEVEKKQTSMADKLAGYGSLYSKENDKFKLTDLSKQVRNLENYGAMLDSLKERGISSSLMEEILGMDVDTALSFGKKLLALNDEKYQAYVDAWDEQQRLASDIAAKYYQDDLDQVEAVYSEKLDAVLSELPEEMQQVGRDTINGWTEGMLNQSSSLYAAVRSIAKKMISEMKTELDIHSPSGKTRDMIGVQAAAGIEEGFMDRMKEATKKMKSAIDAEQLQAALGAASSNGQQLANTGEGRSVYQYTQTDRTPVIKFSGSMAGLAKALLPHLQIEEKRVGPTVVQGGV